MLFSCLASLPLPAQQPVPATATKAPLFASAWGNLEAPAVLPDFAMQRADGTAFSLRSLHGRPTVLVFAGLADLPTAALDALADRYEPYHLQFVAVAVSTAADEFAAWARQHAEGRKWTLVRDAAGPFAPHADEDAAAARKAHRAATILGQVFGDGEPQLPEFVVLDPLGLAIGSTWLPTWEDGVGNLLLRAGVMLRPAHRPKVVVPFEPKQRPAAGASDLLADGSEAPDFAMVDAAGKPVSLAALRGKVVVLDFWATWCRPCLAGLSHQQEVMQKYGSQGVVVVASCTRDPQDKFATWVARNQANFPDVVFAYDLQAMAEQRAAKQLYGVGTIPAQFVIGRDGRIVGSLTGYSMGEVLVDALLAKAGIDVAAETLQKAAADQQRRDKQGANKTVTPRQPGGG